MESEAQDSTIKPPKSPASSGSVGNGADHEASSGSGGNGADHDFECNICFELAQDPVITLCGHLYCWPCLFRWLRLHSNFQECPVCKALIREQKLIPLYGRGKSPTDPRSKPIPAPEIPNRPAGQRTEAASSSGTGMPFNFLLLCLEVLTLMAIASFGYIRIPSLVNFQSHGFSRGIMSGASPASANAFSGRAWETSQEVLADYDLKKLSLIVIGFAILLSVVNY